METSNLFKNNILKIVPTGAYTHTVNLILSDERNNWSHNMFEDDFTGLEVSMGRSRDEINKINKEINNYKSQIDVLREKIEKIEKSDKKPKDYEKIIESNNENINNLINNIFITEGYLNKINKEYKKIEEKHLISVQERRSLRIAKYNYKLHKNLDYLFKEVHYICSYADEYRYGPKYVAPYRNHLLTYDKAPFDEKTVDFLNYRANNFEYPIDVQ